MSGCNMFCLGLFTYEHCLCLSETLSKNAKAKQRLPQWLHRHMSIQQAITDLPLWVSRDIIESLFGHFKQVIRSPQADMNRTALLIPALCGNLDRMTVTQG